MTLGNLVCVIAYTLAVAAALSVLWRQRRANPVFWFLVLQWLIAVGTMAIVDLDRTSDVAYVAAFFLAGSAFVCGHLLVAANLDVSTASDAFWAAPVELDDRLTMLVVAALTLLSVYVSHIYYRAVGYNILISLVRGEILEDVVSMRLAAYSGVEYFAPGYVNQFKNVLLPVGISALALWAWTAGRRATTVGVVAAGVPVALWALLGTGQRGAFVYAVVALLFGLAALGRLSTRTVLIGAPAAVFFFGAMSFYLGRITQLDVLSVIGQVARRAFVNEQTEGLIGFRYVYAQPTSWFEEWGSGLLGILPGHPGSDLDHIIFGIINGTTRGTSTLPTVGSVFHNGSWIGIVTVYVCLGAVYTLLYHRFVSGRRTVLRCLAYGAVFFHLSFFVAGAPISLVNKGVVALAGLLFLRKLRWPSTVPTAAPRAV